MAHAVALPRLSKKQLELLLMSRLTNGNMRDITSSSPIILSLCMS